MSYTEIIYTKDNGVATITINRPKAMNALTKTILEESAKALKTAGEDKDIGVIVLTGEGKAFSAGVDLKALQEIKIEAGGIGSSMDDAAREVIQLIQRVPKPVIAKINGYCFTGALEVALACDLIWIAEEAKLGDTHAKWGLRPTWGMSARLPDAVGMRKARELSFTADTVTGKEAAEWGLANRCVPLAELDTAVRELADKILANSPGSIAAYKTLYNKGNRRHIKKAIHFEEEKKFDITDTADRLAEFTKK